jgi:hypothetical protein
MNITLRVNLSPSHFVAKVITSHHDQGRFNAGEVVGVGIEVLVAQASPLAGSPRRQSSARTIPGAISGVHCSRIKIPKTSAGFNCHRIVTLPEALSSSSIVLGVAHVFQPAAPAVALMVIVCFALSY